MPNDAANIVHREATKRLRAAHSDEYRTLQQAVAAERGLDWKPRLSAQEKAEQSLQTLLDEHPDLAQKFAAQAADAAAAVIEKTTPATPTK